MCHCVMPCAPWWLVMNYLDERRMTAYHESAHTVAAIAFGQLFSRVTIRPVAASPYHPGYLGNVCVYPLPDPRPQDCWPFSVWVESQIVIDLAGYLLEDLLAGSPRRDWFPSRAQPGADHWRVAAVLAALR